MPSSRASAESSCVSAMGSARATICADLLTTVTLRPSLASTQILSQNKPPTATSEHLTSPTGPHGPSRPPQTNQLDALTESHLQEEIDTVLLAIFAFCHDGDLTRIDALWSLPDLIQAQLDEIKSARSDLHRLSGQIVALMSETSKTHLQLQQELLLVLSKYPPLLNRKRSASHDLLATTIETALIKLSLIRARAHQALYDHKSPTNPKADMVRALSAAHAKFQRDQRKLDDEERALDRQIAEYESMLRLVDGGSGGFSQVVEDWARVHRETEECKRDLRRLGWTGD